MNLRQAFGLMVALFWLTLGTACSSPAAGQPQADETSTATQAAAPAQPQALPASRTLETGGATSLTWLPGGAGVAMVGPDQAAVYDPNQKALAPQAVQPAPAAPEAVQNPILLTSSAQQPLSAWVSGGKDVYLWKASAAPRMATQAQAPVTGLALNAGGSSLAVASTDRKVLVYDAAALRPEQSWQAPAWLANLSYAPDSSQVGGADLANSVVYIFDASSGKLLRTLEWVDNPSSNLYGAFFSPDWQQLAWVARSAIQLMVVSSGKPGLLLNHGDAIGALAWSPDSALIASGSASQISGALLPAVYLWDAHSGDLLQTIQQKSPVKSLSFSPDGTQLAVLDSSGQMQVWNIQR